MQILFISEEAQVHKFLSGLQAEAMMPQSNVEISGMSEDSVVTVICSGGSNHYLATITKITSGYQPQSTDGKWLGVKFMVRRNNSMMGYDFERTTLND
jgi:hypothetical protein